MQTPNETSHETDTNRYAFSLVSDSDAEKSCFFVEFNFSQFHHGTIIRTYYTFVF